MNKFYFNQATIIGIGLIGGSLGRDLLKKKIAKKVVGIDVDPKTLSYAKKQGVVSQISKDDIETLEASDLVVFATPVCTLEEQIKDFSAFISENALVIDVGSTKTDIIKVADKSFQSGNFVGCHPMAGSEKSGVRASVSDLFVNSPCIIVPGKKTKKKFTDLATRLWKKLGAQTVLMNVKDHDSRLAACSHLPHILSFATMQSVGKKIPMKELKKIAGRSFKSYTRVAGSDPKMWTDIFLQNKTHALKQISFFQSQLNDIEKAIKKSDSKWLYQYIEKTAKLWREM